MTTPPAPVTEEIRAFQQGFGSPPALARALRQTRFLVAVDADGIAVSFRYPVGGEPGPRLVCAFTTPELAESFAERHGAGPGGSAGWRWLVRAGAELLDTLLPRLTSAPACSSIRAPRTPCPSRRPPSSSPTRSGRWTLMTDPAADLATDATLLAAARRQPERWARGAGGTTVGDGAIDLASGGSFAVVTEVDLYGTLPLRLVRAYDSDPARPAGVFGPGWCSTFDVRLLVDAGGAALVLPDGALVLFPATVTAATDTSATHSAGSTTGANVRWRRRRRDPRRPDAR